MYLPLILFMKICHVTAYYKPAICGVGRVVEELAERMVKDGHEVHVYCSDSDKYRHIQNKEEIINGVHVHRCFNWFTIANTTTFFPSLILKLWKKDFDLIHTHVTGHSYIFFATLVGSLRRIPVVHTTHCPWTTGFRPWWADFLAPINYHLFSRFCFWLTSKVIAITPWELGFLQNYGCSKRKISVIPNGVDDIFYKSREKERASLRKKLGVKNNEIIVLFLGRLNPTKGVDVLARAGKELVQKNKDYWFFFVGPDEGMEETVKEIIKDERNMKLLGAIKGIDAKRRLAEMYAAADIFCLPSYREGLPLTLFEAMASGLPIIASPVNGVPYEMQQPENGFFVPYGEVELLKKRIIELGENKKLREEISKRNRIWAKKYNWNDIFQKVMNLYEEFK